MTNAPLYAPDQRLILICAIVGAVIVLAVVAIILVRVSRRRRGREARGFPVNALEQHQDNISN